MRLVRVAAFGSAGSVLADVFDDDFSKSVLKRFVADLDDDKTIFLQSDIDSFKRFESKIDDEIHGAPLESFYTISKTYLQRIDEVVHIDDPALQ